MAIEEVERFDDISALGFLTAEQEPSIATTDGSIDRCEIFERCSFLLNVNLLYPWTTF